MSTHLPGFQSFFSFFVLFCIGQIIHQQHYTGYTPPSRASTFPAVCSSKCGKSSCRLRISFLAIRHHHHHCRHRYTETLRTFEHVNYDVHNSFYQCTSLDTSSSGGCRWAGQLQYNQCKLQATASQRCTLHRAK